MKKRLLGGVVILLGALAIAASVGCAARTVAVDHPTNWLSLDGSRIADQQVYYDCLRAARHMETESQSNIGGGAFGGGQAAITGSSASRQSMKTDAPLLTACMASKGYRLRSPDELERRVPYETAKVTLRSRKAWIMEVNSPDKRDAYWMGSWIATDCDAWFREFLSKPANRAYAVRSCRAATVTDEGSGSAAWLAAGPQVFIGGATEERCQYILERSKFSSQEPCRKLWIRME